MINYVISLWGGERRASNGFSDINEYVERHIKFLSSKPSHITGFTFVVSRSDNSDEQNVINKINDFIESSSLNGLIIERDNNYGSYGSWNRGIMDTYKDYDYSFVIEDDYIPTRNDFVDFFLEKDNNDIGFVASLYGRNHARISNGLLSHRSISNVLESNDDIFLLCSDTEDEYGISRCPTEVGFGHSQKEFLKLVERCGYSFTDITDIASTKFVDDKRNIIVYNDINLPIIIEPITGDNL